MFDLHTHTSISDGTVSPEGIVKLAVKNGIRFLALTDHDTTSGIQPARQASIGYNVEIIPGLELSTDIDDNEIHILGYYIDPDNKKLQEFLEKLRFYREKRIDKILDKLADRGINLNRRTVEKFSQGDSIGRPHVARTLVAKGYVSNVKEAFTRYLDKSAPCYVPREKMTPRQAIQMIVSAGGVPVLAHPGKMKNFIKVLPELIRYGLRGIEAFYPSHSPLQEGYYTDVARKYNLVITAGSDFHGSVDGNISNPGCPAAPRWVIYEFLDFCGERRRVEKKKIQGEN